MAQEFRLLFSPIKIGSMTVKNRVVMCAHGFWFKDFVERGKVPTDRLVRYWEERAKGGAGMIGNYLTTVDPFTPDFWRTFRRPDAKEGFGKAAETLHKYGTKFYVQLAHFGGEWGVFQPPGPVAPSAMPYESHTGLPSFMPRELSTPEIEEIVAEFAFSAKICQEAGVDAVELHAAHGYLLNEFLSPYYNRRTDKYGGSRENRLRFVREIIDAVRREVGRDYVVGIRLNVEDYVDGGITLEEGRVIAKTLADDGKLDYMNISGSTYISTPLVIDPMYFPLGSTTYLAASIKEVVSIPVIARGRIIDPIQAEQILESSQADLVAMTRAQIADPEIIKKTQEGRLDEIRKCLGCSEGCWGTVVNLARGFMLGMTCTMNPTVGREMLPGWYELIPAEKKKQVMVIGGGPAGLEAARVAASRGHQVSLYEKGPELGGQTLIAAKAPGRDGFLDCPHYYSYQMKFLGVGLHLNSEVDVELVKKINPDVVVIATGAVTYVPDIPGVEQDNVVDAWDVLSGKVEVGDNVVVIAGEQHMTSLSTADFLASQGKKVELISEGYQFGTLAEIDTKIACFHRLCLNNVVFTTMMKVKEISGNTISLENFYNRKIKRQIEGVDNVVLAYTGQKNDFLYHALKGEVKELYAVGDCFASTALPAAIASGAEVARKI